MIGEQHASATFSSRLLAAFALPPLQRSGAKSKDIAWKPAGLNLHPPRAMAGQLGWLSAMLFRTATPPGSSRASAAAGRRRGGGSPGRQLAVVPRRSELRETRRKTLQRRNGCCPGCTVMNTRHLQEQQRGESFKRRASALEWLLRPAFDNNPRRSGPSRWRTVHICCMDCGRHSPAGGGQRLRQPGFQRPAQSDDRCWQ